MLQPILEGGVRKNRGISIPVNLRSGPERRLNVGYTASNSYLNPGYIVCRDRSCRADYETDHTGNLLFATITQPVLEAFELGVTLATYEMNNIPAAALVHRFVSDSALRTFHEDILGEDSLPELSNAPDGRQVFAINDLDGRQLVLEPEHAYALPLRIDLTRYFDIRQNARTRMSLNVGAHMAIPLEGDVDAAAGKTAFSRGIDFGFSANFTRSLQLTPNLSSTFHAQVARFRNDVHVVNENSPLHGDEFVRSQYALTYGLRFAGTFAGSAPCSFSLSQHSTSSQYEKDRYWTADTVIFEGGNNLRGALVGANDYGVMSFGCEYRGRQYQVTLVEDIGGFSQLLDDDGAGTSYDPDFVVGVAVSWVPGSRRNEGS